MVIEFENKHRSTPELRRQCLFLANNSPGNLLRYIVAMKLYLSGACIALVYLRDPQEVFQFSAAYSFGRAPLSARELFYWRDDDDAYGELISRCPEYSFHASHPRSGYLAQHQRSCGRCVPPHACRIWTSRHRLRRIAEFIDM